MLNALSRKGVKKLQKILASCLIKTFMDSSNVKVRHKLYVSCLDKISSLDSSMNM